MPRYQPGKVLDGFVILEPGEYDFEVVEAHNKSGKKPPHNDQIELRLKSQDAIYFDYLVFTDKSFWKVNQFRKAIGQEIEEGEDEIDFNAEDCLGATGRVMLTVDTYEGKRKNKVVEYLESDL
jgi:hypothetical protein